jgi:hypothetical protein
MKAGDKAKVAPAVTGLDEWIEGTVIAIKDKMNRIFFGEEKYFKLQENKRACLHLS